MPTTFSAFGLIRALKGDAAAAIWLHTVLISEGPRFGCRFVILAESYPKKAQVRIALSGLRFVETSKG
jgi:hypothetical protein